MKTGDETRTHGEVLVIRLEELANNIRNNLFHHIPTHHAAGKADFLVSLARTLLKLETVAGEVVRYERSIEDLCDVLTDLGVETEPKEDQP